MPLETRRDVLVSTAVAADRLGYDGYYLPETWAYDTTIVLAEAAVRTERIGLGTGVLGVWNRSAATIAMAAATLASVSGGRFTLGLGISTPQLAEGLHDVAFEAPLGRLRRTIEQVRALLRGERIPLAVATGARPLKLNVPPPPEIPIYVAAIGEQSVRLTGELADGWVPFIYPRRCLAQGIEVLREGPARGWPAGTPPAPSCRCCCCARSSPTRSSSSRWTPYGRPGGHDMDPNVTGRDRVSAAYKGKFADCVPAYPIAGSFAGCLDGL